jgi:hypothetical protein
MLDHSCPVHRHPLAERGHDLYETPVVAVEALLRVEQLPHRLWDPACGPGNIVNTLRAAGHEVIGSDLINYGDPTHFYGRDFLLEPKVPDGCEGIVFNPPYRIVERFIDHAIKISPYVAALLRLAFLESERRCEILEGCGLARVFVFRKRLPMMHRANWQGPKASSAMSFAWFAGHAITSARQRSTAFPGSVEMTGGRVSRQKGNRTERAVVRLLQDRGLAAERVPLSGAARGRFGGDVSVPVLGRDLRCEVKCRGNGFNRLYDWLGDHDFLVIRADRKPLLVIARIELAAEIVMAAERGKGSAP